MPKVKVTMSMLCVSSHLNELLIDVTASGEEKEGSSSLITWVIERGPVQGNRPTGSWFCREPHLQTLPPTDEFPGGAGGLSAKLPQTPSDSCSRSSIQREEVLG